MSRIEQLDIQFRALHEAAYREYTEATQHARAEHEAQLAQDMGREAEQHKAIQRISQLSMDDLTRADQARQDAMKEHVAQKRARLMERSSREPLSAKRNAILASLGASGVLSVPVFASSILTSDKEDVSDIPGEHGNPWVLPWNPGQVKISQSAASSEYGLCGAARAYRPPVVTEFWFAFLADRTGLWSFLALVDAFGFYLLNTVSGFWLCRYTRVTVNASMNVYQYFWFGEKKFLILDERSDSGFRSGFCDEYGIFDYQPFLRADSNAYVFARIRVTISADAYGSGAWSQVNFKDGAANYIKPLLLVANPPR